MPNEALPIYRDFTQEALSALVTRDAEQTPEAFEARIIKGIEQLLEEQRQKLNGCLIAIDSENVLIIYGHREMDTDDALDKALTEHDRALSDGVWGEHLLWIGFRESHRSKPARFRPRASARAVQ